MEIPEDYYLIVDVEATCADDGSLPRAEMEIIEIGAVALRRADLVTTREFQTFVRPVRHPRLTPFCRDLTTIHQQDVDAAPSFPEAIGRLRGWLEAVPSHRMCSWGGFDPHRLRGDCAYHRVPYPFGPAHLDVAGRFAAWQGRRRGPGPGLRRAMAILELPTLGTPHRALDDARSVASIVRAVRS